MTRQEAAAVVDRFLDGSVGPWDWDDFISTRHGDVVVERAARMGATLSQLYPAEIRGHYCNAAGLELLRTLAASLRGPPSRAGGGGDIVASALEADAALQEAGDLLRLGAAQERTWAQVVAVAPDYGDAIAFAFTFWDEWADAATTNGDITIR